MKFQFCWKGVTKLREITDFRLNQAEICQSNFNQSFDQNSKDCRVFFAYWENQLTVDCIHSVYRLSVVCLPYQTKQCRTTLSSLGFIVTSIYFIVGHDFCRHFCPKKPAKFSLNISLFQAFFVAQNFRHGKCFLFNKYF